MNKREEIIQYTSNIQFCPKMKTVGEVDNSDNGSNSTGLDFSNYTY